MDYLKSLKKYLTQVLTSTTVLISDTCSAALPTTYGGATPPNNGNWFDLIKNYMGEGGDVLGLGLTEISFIVAAYFVIAKVGEARKGDVEWVEVVVTSGFGAAAVMLISFFADQAQLVI